MTKYEQLDQLLREQNGLLRAADLKTVEVSRQYFAEYVKARGLERVAHEAADPVVRILS